MKEIIEGNNQQYRITAGIKQLSAKVASLYLRSRVTHSITQRFHVGERSWPNLFLAL